MATRSTTRKRRIELDDFEDEVDSPLPVEEEEEKPRRRPAVRDEEPVDETGDEDADEPETIIPIARGRKEIGKSRPSSDSGSIYFRWGDDGDVQVVKFLDAEPWGYGQHWVTREGKKSFPCLGPGCPLCEVGVKVSQKVVFSVLNLSTPEPIVQAFEVSPTLDDILTAYDSDKKTGPLPRLYWALSRTKAARSSGFQRYNYTFTPIKERDLDEDYGIDPDAIEVDLEGAKPLEPKTVLGAVTRRTVQEVADELMGD